MDMLYASRALALDKHILQYIKLISSELNDLYMPRGSNWLRVRRHFARELIMMDLTPTAAQRKKMDFRKAIKEQS